MGRRQERVGLCAGLRSDSSATEHRLTGLQRYVIIKDKLSISVKWPGWFGFRPYHAYHSVLCARLPSRSLDKPSRMVVDAMVQISLHYDYSKTSSETPAAIPPRPPSLPPPPPPLSPRPPSQLKTPTPAPPPQSPPPPLHPLPLCSRSVHPTPRAPAANRLRRRMSLPPWRARWGTQCMQRTCCGSTTSHCRT